MTLALAITMLALLLIISAATHKTPQPITVTTAEYRLQNYAWLQKLDRAYREGLISKAERNHRAKSELRGRRLIKV